MNSTHRALTEEQRKIALDTSHHMMVEAGAGSGKTTLLIEKLAHELGHGNIRDAQPEAVLSLDQVAAITFTRKAAGEIKERLRAEFLRRASEAKGAGREVWAERAFAIDEALIGTIDSFAGRIVRDYGALAGMESGFEVLEPGDALTLRHEVVEAELLAGIERGHGGAEFLVRQYGFRRACTILLSFLDNAALLTDVLDRMRAGKISYERLAREQAFKLTPKDLLLEPWAHELLAFANLVHDAYVRRLDWRGVLDHDHVVLRAAALADNEDVQQAFRQRVKLMFVDEFQDTNLAQAQLLLRLTGVSAAARNRSEEAPAAPETRLVLVGDPKQSIYGFRHADITMWRKSQIMLERAGGRYYTLTANHRSRPSIVRFFDDCFGRIMGERDASGSEYDVPFQPLTPARPESEGHGVEILLADEGGASAVASVVAERIREMLANPADHPVFERGDDGAEVERPLRARDIAILARNLKGQADHYERALRERGIDAYVYGGRGLYARQEIADVTSLLRAVADPYDDVFLVAFLRSPMGGVDDATLAELAAASSAAPNRRSGRPLYDALHDAARLVGDPAGRARALGALRILERLRSLRERLPHNELIEVALDETGYRAFLAGAPDAPAGLRNIEKLLRIARRAAHEPLFEFVQRLDARVRRADPEDEAPLYTPDDDLVTISTIHKAKGLEWPYVFVVGIDQPMFRRVNSEQPHLSRHLGVTLPLTVMLKNEEGSTEVAGSEIWNWHFKEATQREYAEAKRLFYVAATRARDRLVLAGALARPRPERRLTGRIDQLHRQGYEHWLRHLYPALTKTNDEGKGAEFSYADGLHTGKILRPGQEARTLPVVRSRSWLKAPPIPLTGLRAPASSQNGLEARTGSVTDRSILRGNFTASELLQFAGCAFRHYYGYIKSVSSPTVEVASRDAVVNQILPEKRGDILHDYLREHRDSWSEERMHAEMRRALLRHLPMGEETADENARELMVHARNYLASEWYARVKAAKRVLREVPFVVQLTPALRLQGAFDLMFEEADGWRIIDFKTGLFRGLEHRIKEEVARRVTEYEIQAGVYTLAANTAGFPVREFVFFFTAPALASSIQPDEIWLAKQRAKIETIAGRIQALDHGPEPSYEAERCDNCEFLQLCRPAGTPEDLLHKPRAT